MENDRKAEDSSIDDIFFIIFIAILSIPGMILQIITHILYIPARYFFCDGYELTITRINEVYAYSPIRARRLLEAKKKLEKAIELIDSANARIEGTAVTEDIVKLGFGGLHLLAKQKLEILDSMIYVDNKKKDCIDEVEG